MRRLAGAALLAVVVAGCGNDYQETDVSAVVSSFAGASSNQADTVDTHHISITEGHLVKAHIVVLDDDNKPMGLALRSTNPSVIDVHYVITPDDFAFIANGVGTADIEVIAEGTRVLTIQAIVVPQPSP